MSLPNEKTQVQEQEVISPKKISYMQKSLQLLPGLMLCTIIMILSSYFAKWFGTGINNYQGLPLNNPSAISGIFVAVILGLFVRNIIGLQEVFKKGIMFSINAMLKLGIILLGIRLSFFDVIKLGAWGIPIIITCIASGLLITLWITNKMNESHRLGTLVASGTAICGVTAIAAISPSIKANDEELAYAIANITLFGLITMLLYPYIAFYLFHADPIQAGLFLGTAIHDTAQVTGAALMYHQMFHIEEVIETATITKLTRNVFIIAVVPILTYLNRSKIVNEAEQVNPVKWYQLMPLFVIGFIALTIIRSIGDAGVAKDELAFGLISSPQWTAIHHSLSTFGSYYLLGIGMAGVGLSTRLGIFKSLGIKPFYIGMVAALSVSIISLIMVYLISGFITM
ncbi:YeiH family protein [Halalkalibacter lacteus]|uniref:YeiH family protein n=1 Tax=Halalkalibacter lacteus TaxID=3090663 RepID=UPI002FCA87D6